MRRKIAGAERLQPRPNGPLPLPESYDSESAGPNLDRPGDAKIGTDIDAVPVLGLTPNFSPMPRIAPPPLGSDRLGAATMKSLRSELASGVGGPCSSAPFLPAVCAESTGAIMIQIRQSNHKNERRRSFKAKRFRGGRSMTIHTSRAGNRYRLRSEKRSLREQLKLF